MWTSWQQIRVLPRFRCANHFVQKDRMCISYGLCTRSIGLSDETKTESANDPDKFGTLTEPLEKSELRSNPFKSNINKYSRHLNVKNYAVTSKEKRISNRKHGIEKLTSNQDLNTEGEDSDEDTEFTPTDVERKSSLKYLAEMKILVREKKLQEALALYAQMKKEKVFPKMYIFTFLIGACGRVGYTRMAFKLFKQMRDRHMDPSSATLTGLFNSCAESPYPELGLEKAHLLKEKIIENRWSLSTITYHAMIKAFGKCGDLQTAFKIVDEMKQAGHAITSEAFNFLLMSCISDKEAGFTHAIQVLRKMRRFKIHPTIHSYNLLLRAVRECGVGPPEISSQLLLDWSFKKTDQQKKSITDHKDQFLPENTNLSTKPYRFLQADDSQDDNKVMDTFSDKKNEVLNIRVAPSESSSVLNLLAPRPLLNDEVLGLQSIHTPVERLAVIGGLEGVMSGMISLGIQPDVKTLSILLDCIPSTQDAEQILLDFIQRYKIKPNIDFFNLLIKRRNFRNDYEGAMEVVDIIHKYGLYVDIVTFGVLALGCSKRKQGLKLLSDMEEAGFQPNVEIIGALCNKARCSWDYKYLLDMMNVMKKYSIKPNPKILDILERARSMANTMQLRKNQGVSVDMEKLKWCKLFCLNYEKWLQSAEVDLPEHPWNQYKVKI